MAYTWQNTGALSPGLDMLLRKVFSSSSRLNSILSAILTDEATSNLPALIKALSWVFWTLIDQATT